MGLIRQSEGGSLLRDAIVLDLGDLQRQAEVIKERTREQASKIVDEARLERERLLSDARQAGLLLGRDEGFKKGLEEGKAQGAAQGIEERRAALDVLIKGWGKALEAFVLERESVLADARRGVLELAVAIAEKVVSRVIEADPAQVQAQVEKVLALVARPSRLVLRVHPLDASLAREAMPTLLARFPMAEHAEIRVDESLPRGSCRATTAGGGEIDATIATQIERLAESIVPGKGQKP